MQLLALDIATNSGWAFGEVPDAPLPTPLEVRAGEPVYKPNSGTFRLPKGSRVSFRLAAYQDWLQDLIALVGAEALVFEAPFVTGQTHQDTARLLMYLAGATELTAERAGIGKNLFEANNATVRKHFINKGTGKRAELKRMTLEACWSIGWMDFSDDDDNRADALAVWHYAASRLQMQQRRES